MDHSFDFTGKTAVVTGGSGVLCGAVCRRLAACGAHVAILANSNLQIAEALVADIERGGGQAMALQADVLSKDSLTEVQEKVLDAYGQIDFLVNGAGGARKEATTSADLPFFDLPEEAVRWVFDLNFLGTFFACQVFGKHMADRESGCIVNFSSRGAFSPLTRSVAYSAAKAAVTNFTQWLAVHLSQEYSPNIRVNAVVPGFFLTEQNRFLLTDEATGNLSERGRRIIDHTPMGRFGKPEDVVGPTLWLLSDAAAFVHGSCIPVGGGIAAYGGV